MCIELIEIRAYVNRERFKEIRMAEPKKVIIVGAGFGGLEAARTLPRSDVEITVIDRMNHHLFQPLLYQVCLLYTSPSP